MSTTLGTPRVWVFVGHRHGDNAQVRALAEAVGFPFEEKEILFSGKRRLPNWIAGRTRATFDVERSSPLIAPWPDAIVAVGYRAVPIARWVQKQSGGGTRLIHIGRPRAPLRWFDLVITTPQYDLPARPNVVLRDLPIVAARAPAHDSPLDDADGWRQRFRTDDGPVIGVLVGGDAMPYRFDLDSAEALACGARALARRVEGHLTITCGPRVSAASADELERCSDDRVALFHRFSDRDLPNPYAALMVLADHLVVTTDSVSMMAEAVATGKPVHLVTPNMKNTGAKGLILTLGAAFETCLPRPIRERLIAAGLVTPVRKTERIAVALLKSGAAIGLGNTDPPAIRPPAPSIPDTLVRHIRDLISDAQSGDPT